MAQAAPKSTPILSFRSSSEWLDWLRKNHAKSSGIWLKIAKKDTTAQSISYNEALEAALRYGWIDSQKKGYDELAWLQRFGPRGARSIWSKRNRDTAQKLIDSGRMKLPGLRAVERAKETGQWEAAYDSQRGVAVPEDLQKELDQHPQADKFFRELNSANRYAILHRIQTAKKPETRARRIHQYVEMLAKGEKIYP
jgi:uncharacterized protein YdeI (YjbR/CyaY-like superfamily)